MLIFIFISMLTVRFIRPWFLPQKKDFFLISSLVKQMGASLSEVHREALLWFF